MTTIKFPIQKIKNSIIYAYEHIQFYKKRFDAINFNPYSIQNYKDFTKIPILYKNDVQDMSHELQKFISDEFDINNNSNKPLLLFEQTSGSTGIPLYCCKSRQERIQSAFSAWKVRKWWNKNIIGKPAVAICVVPNGQQTFKSSRDYFLSINNINDELLHDYCEKMKEFNPYWMYGVPSAIYQLALFLEKNPIYKNNFNFSFIELQGEYILPEYKNFIEKIFNCKTTNQYGCIELWVMAYSCKNDKLHILEEDVFIEIVNEKGVPVPRGETGEIVVTGFNIKSMSFIRYNLGDIGKISINKCLCGHNSSILELIGSRTSQRFILANGKQFDGSIFYNIIQKTFEGSPINNFIKNFRIKQESLNEISFYISKGHMYDIHQNEIQNVILKNIHHFIDENIKVNFLQKDTFENINKKFTYFESNISKNKK